MLFCLQKGYQREVGAGLQNWYMSTYISVILVKMVALQSWKMRSSKGNMYRDVKTRRLEVTNWSFNPPWGHVTKAEWFLWDDYPWDSDRRLFRWLWRKRIPYRRFKVVTFLEIPDPWVGHLTIGKVHLYNHPRKVTFSQVYWFMFSSCPMFRITGTHPETNSSHLKIGPKPKVIFQPSIFKWSFRKGKNILS